MLLEILFIDKFCSIDFFIFDFFLIDKTFIFFYN